MLLLKVQPWLNKQKMQLAIRRSVFMIVSQISLIAIFFPAGLLQKANTDVTVFYLKLSIRPYLYLCAEAS